MDSRALELALVSLLTPIAVASIIHIPAHEPSIQAGIDAAADGDTVLVAPGTYVSCSHNSCRKSGQRFRK